VGQIRSRGRAKRTAMSCLVAAMLVAGVPALMQTATVRGADAAPLTGTAAPRTPPASCATTLLCSTSFSGDGANVKTANGKAWVLTVSASSSNSVTVEIARVASASPVADELHGWTFPVTSGGLAFSTRTGVGTIKPGARTRPSAAVDVTFRAKSHKVVAGACTSGSETEYSGTLTGSVKLVTDLTGGGTVSAKSFTAKQSAPVVTVYKNCLAPNACESSSTTFDDDPSPLADPSLSAEGITGIFAGKTFDQVTISRDVTLAKPARAYRVDESLIKAAPAKWTASTKTLVVSTKASGLITGSVAIGGGTPSSSKEPCTLKGKKRDNLLSFYNNASWSSPAGRALTAHDNIGGSLVMPLSSKVADVILVTTTS
jgi:hypothetical protein